MKPTLKCIILSLFSLLFSFASFSQVAFSYDESGNRTKASITITNMFNTENKNNELYNASTDSVLTKQHIKIYPNPSSNILNIEFCDDFTSTMIMYDMEGKIVLEKDLLKQHNEIEIEKLKSGYYIIELSKNKAQTWKMLKQ